VWAVEAGVLGLIDLVAAVWLGVGQGGIGVGDGESLDGGAITITFYQAGCDFEH
jgi:hypothetical protein